MQSGPGIRVHNRPLNALATLYELEMWWQWCCSKVSWVTFPSIWLPLFSPLTGQLPTIKSTTHDPKDIIRNFNKSGKLRDGLKFLSRQTSFASCRSLSVDSKYRLQVSMLTVPKCVLSPTTSQCVAYHLHLYVYSPGPDSSTSNLDEPQENNFLTKRGEMEDTISKQLMQNEVIKVW